MRLVLAPGSLLTASLIAAALALGLTFATCSGLGLLTFDWRYALPSVASGAALFAAVVKLDKRLPRDPPPPMIGAEGNVDRIVRERFFADQSSGVVVEVGAARPDYLSISALYRSLGWKVVAIDPNPAYAEQYRTLGYELLQYACAEQDSDDVDFTVVDSHETAYRGGGVTFESFSSLGVRGDFATLKSDLDTKTIKVKVRRLDNILRQHAPAVERIDVLAVDVEGWELEVLRGLDFPRYKPKVVILENLFYDASYRRFMRDRGYFLYRLLAPNEVWVRREEVEWLERPSSMFEAWTATLAGRAAIALRRLRPA